MKKVLSYFAVLLCLAILIQSIPVSAIADTFSAESEELFANADTNAYDAELTGETADSTPYILGELTDERTLDTKIFRMSDGSQTAAVYPTQVHYEEGDQLKEIDYRFEEITVDGESFYETKSGPVSLRVPETISDDSAVVFSSGEHSISFSLSAIEEIDAHIAEAETDTKRLEGLRETIFAEVLSSESFEELYSKPRAEAKTLDMELSEAIDELSDIMLSVPGAASSVSYGSVMNGIDLNYSISGTMLKEEIVLNRQASALKTFSFTLDTGDLTPVLNKDGSVSLNDLNGKEKLHIASPFMYDRVGAESSDIDVSLTPNGDNTYTYKLTPDKKWLGSAERFYPVTIDPPVTDSNSSTVADTTAVLGTSIGDLAQNGEPLYLKVGDRWDSSLGAANELQAIVYSALPAALNSTTNIVRAHLYLYSYRNSFASCQTDMQINAHRITSSWNSDNVPLAVGANGNADYNDVLDYAFFNDSEPDTRVQYSFDITEAAQMWLNGDAPNYGIALRGVDTAGTRKVARFYDSSHPDLQNQGDSYAVFPTFVYVYRDSKGIEDYWSFTTMSAGRSGVAAVNNYNGNLVLVHDLISSTGTVMPVCVSAIFSANSADNNSAGLGMWRTNYHMKIETCNLSFEMPGGAETINYKYCFRDSDGTKHYLKEEGDEHKDEDGLGLTMTLIEGNADLKYKLETKDHTEYSFDHFGRLRVIKDSNGNKNTVCYESYTDPSSNKITSIIEGCDFDTTVRTTVFQYLSDGNVKITSHEGSSVTLDFLSAENRSFNGITYPDGKYVWMEYALVGAGYFPSLITDSNGHKTEISYTDGIAKRVNTLKWGTAQETLERYTFTYDTNHSTVTDIKGRRTSMQFNGFGQTVGIANYTSSIGQSYEFGAPGGAKEGEENKLLLTSKTVYASENRMKSGGFNSWSSVNNYTVYPSATGVTKSYESEKGNTGTGRMKLTKAADCTDVRFVYQSISGLAIGRYTLSAYVSTNGGTLSAGGAHLTANVFDSSGYRTNATSSRVTYTKSGEWIRLQTTVQVLYGDTKINAGITLPEGTAGTVYVDDIQLEYNISGGAGSFNQLGNPAFTANSLEGWGGTGGFTASSVSAAANVPAAVTRSANVTGDPSTVKTLRQIVYLEGEKGDVFITGAWAKANSVPLGEETAGKKGRPEFGLHVTFYNGDTKVGDTFEVQYNAGINEWQFLTDKLIAEGAYDKIYVSFVYNYNTGNASVTLPFLYKESYGQSYVYDENGNVISSTDKAETEATFAYQDETLTQSLSPTGSRYMYSNDDTTYNTTYAVSNSGQRISFGYDGAGNARYMYVTDLDQIAELSYTSGESISCYIVNAKNGKTLEPTGSGEGRYVYAKDFELAAGEQWELRYLSGRVYTIREKANTANGIYVNDNGGLQEGAVTVNSSWVPTVPFKFALEENGDGTFRISTAKSNHEKYLYQTDNLHYSGSNSYIIGSGEYDEDDPAYDWYLIATTSGTDKMRTDATYGFNDADAWNIEKSEDTLGNETNYSYNDKGLLETVTDPKGNETSYTYDAIGRTTMVESGDSKVQYTYENDLLENISVDSGQVQYGFEYDSFGRKTAVTVGNGESSRTLAQYLYVNALLSRQTYGNGTNFIDFYYDSLDRLLTKTYNNDPTKTVHYLYDPNGNQYGVVDNIWGKKTLFEYDLASRVNGVGVYDLSGIMRGYESIRYNDGKNTVESIVHSMFNSSGAKLKVTEYTYEYGDPSKGEMPDVLYSYGAGGRFFSFAYDDLGRLTTRTLGLSDTDGVESYTYMASSKGEGYTSTVVESMTDFTGKTHTYTYDDNGNILTDTYDGNTVSYEYDSLNRMVRYNDPVFGWTYVYVYDDRGNITEMREYEYSAGTLPAIYNSYEYTYGDSTWADLLTSYWGEDISYDELGNPLNWIWGETLTWQNGRQLASYDGTVNYSYNADGLRVAKSGAKNTEYYVVNGTYIGEVSTVNGTQYVIAYVYDENGAPAGLNVNGSAYYFAKNLQGDVTAILDYQGNVVANYRYDAYGAIISVTDASGATISSATHIANLNPFRYRGYMYDSESGFYYLRSRYYDPFVGRFLNADTIVADIGGEELGYNVFIYCFNNPINMSDSAGNWGKWIKSAIKAVAEKIVKPVVSVLRKGNIEYSQSQSLNFQIGCITVGGALGFSSHTNGDVSLIAELSFDISTGSGFGVSSKTNKSINFLPSYEKYHNDSSYVAVNATAPIPYTPISGDGSLSFNQNYTEDGDKMYPGFAMEYGAALPNVTNLELSISAGASRSYDIVTVNIYDELEKLYIKIMEE